MGEFIESFKLTDIERVEKEGLDRKDLAKRVADTFLYQIVDTAYFHCDPHPGNLAVDTSGNLVYYDFGMMDELSPNVEAAGVLAKGADRLSSEQLARYFVRAFKDKQLGKDRSDGPGIKSTLGTELQSLTESQVFRFPSTFTFIFRAIASIDGIGKGLDEDYDLGEFAQPFVTKLIDKVKYGGDNSKKSLAVVGHDEFTIVVVGAERRQRREIGAHSAVGLVRYCGPAGVLRFELVAEALGAGQEGGEVHVE